MRGAHISLGFIKMCTCDCKIENVCKCFGLFILNNFLDHTAFPFTKQMIEEKTVLIFLNKAVTTK